MAGGGHTCSTSCYGPVGMRILDNYCVYFLQKAHFCRTLKHNMTISLAKLKRSYRLD